MAASFKRFRISEAYVNIYVRKNSENREINSIIFSCYKFLTKFLDKPLIVYANVQICQSRLVNLITFILSRIVVEKVIRVM